MRMYIVCLLLAAAIFPSCTKEELAPGLEGNMVGYAYTFDEFATLLNDHSGITVTTEGPNKYMAVTDSEGRYEFQRLPTGTYNLRFEKPGFGTMKWYGIKHLGGSATIIGFTFGYNGSRNVIYVYKFPKTKITELSVVNDSLYAKFDLNENEPSGMKLNIYFSENPGFDIGNARQMVTKTLFPVKGRYGCRLNQATFNPPLPKGTEIFYRACIFNTASGVKIPSMGNLSVSGSSTYVDYYLNKTVYPGQGDPSEEYSFITLQ
jgi:hypothetical protein